MTASCCCRCKRGQSMGYTATEAWLDAGPSRFCIAGAVARRGQGVASRGSTRADHLRLLVVCGWCCTCVSALHAWPPLAQHTTVADHRAGVWLVSSLFRFGPSRWGPAPDRIPRPPACRTCAHGGRFVGFIAITIWQDHAARTMRNWSRLSAPATPGHDRLSRSPAAARAAEQALTQINRMIDQQVYTLPPTMCFLPGP